MESEYVKNTIQDYDKRLKLLARRKKALKREKGHLIELGDKITNILGYSFAKWVLGKRLQVFKEESISCYVEKRNVERLRDATIFYTKYDAENNKEIIGRMEQLNKQARIDQTERERIFGNTEIQKAKVRNWTPPKANM